METYDLENIDGLIFGISNVANGLLMKELSRPFINLSVPSQDLYYENMILDKCIEQ